MTSAFRITLAVMGAGLALVAAGCGGGNESVPDDVVAVVGDTEVTKAELDKYIGYAKKGYEASKQEFPKVGTPEYKSVQTQWVGYLVQLAELKQEADKLGIEITEKDVDKAEQDFIKERFGGKRSEYEKALKAQGFTPADYRLAHESSALNTKLFDVIAKDVEVTDEDVLAFYTQNQANYPASVDFAKSKTEAERIYRQLKAGASFAALAKANSDDEGTKAQGGKLTIKRGETVPEFDKMAFELETGEMSKPVKTQYGYHVIQAVSPVKNGSRDVRHILIATKSSGSSFESYKDTIRAQLLQQRKNEKMQAWMEDLAKDYEGKISYAEGYELPELPEVPATTATE